MPENFWKSSIVWSNTATFLPDDCTHCGMQHCVFCLFVLKLSHLCMCVLVDVPLDVLSTGLTRKSVSGSMLKHSILVYVGLSYTMG